MLLRNLDSRLITINGDYDAVQGVRKQSFKILPGENPAVEVPDELCKTKFVQALIADGKLSVLQDAAPVQVEEDDQDDESLYEGLDKAQLKALCDDRNIEYVERDTAKQLIAKLEA